MLNWFFTGQGLQLKNFYHRSDDYEEDKIVSKDRQGNISNRLKVLTLETWQNQEIPLSLLGLYMRYSVSNTVQGPSVQSERQAVSEKLLKYTLDP